MSIDIITKRPPGRARLELNTSTDAVVVRKADSTTIALTGGGGGGTPASTVVSETTYGQASAVGVATTYARGDHTHGTPALPTPAAIGAEVAGTMAAHVEAADPHPGYALESALSAAEATAAAALATHAADTSLHLGAPSNTDLNGAYGRNFDITPVGASVASPGVTLTTGGTVTAQIDNNGKVWARFTANASQFAGIRGSANNFLIMASGGTFTFRVRMPSSASSHRLWIGWQSVLVGSGATPAGHYAGLVMDSQTGGSLVCYVAARDGTTFSTTSTGVTLAADTEYHGTVRISSSGVYVAIAAAGVSLPAETAHTTNLPGSTTQLGPVVGLYGSSTHSLDVRGANYNVSY